jgi:hypothetical protein
VSAVVELLFLALAGTLQRACIDRETARKLTMIAIVL